MAPKLPLVPNDFKLTTWLAVGAIFQSTVMTCFPGRITMALPFVLVLSRMILTYLEAKGIRALPSTVKRGRWTTRIPLGINAEMQDRSKGGFVLFVLGARTLQ